MFVCLYVCVCDISSNKRIKMLEAHQKKIDGKNAEAHTLRTLKKKPNTFLNYAKFIFESPPIFSSRKLKNFCLKTTFFFDISVY